MGDDRHGIFAGDDPFLLAQSWLEAASASEPNDPNAAALATVDAAGLPDVRVVLVKDIAAGGLTFFTNRESAKGSQLLANPQAALVFHWKSLRRQMRFRGPVSLVPDSASDSYFMTRHPVSRLGAWASSQSRPLQGRAELEARLETMRAQFGDNATRPPYWGGFCLNPVQIEFWADGQNRLHDRFCWTRSGIDAKWDVLRLNP